MTADAHRHHPAAEKTPKNFRYGRTGITKYGRPVRPFPQAPPHSSYPPVGDPSCCGDPVGGGFRVLGSDGCRRTPQRPRHGVHAGESR